jgi:probable HAF family extracellular repeat protein
MGRSVTAALVALALILAPTAPAQSTPPSTVDYQTVELGTLGGTSSYATAMNDRGEVVGRGQTADGTYHGFRWRRGVMTDLGDVINPLAINNRGQIAGYRDTDAGGRAFVWTRGRLRDLGTLGGSSSFALAINDRGQVVGTSATADGRNHTFLWTNGRMRQLPLDSVSGINNRGQVAGGVITEGGGFHAAVWRRGRVTDLGALAFDRSNTYGINQRGWVIGWTFSPEQDERGTLWRHGTRIDVGTLGGSWTRLIAVNDRGQILAVSDTAGGGDHPALWRRGGLTDLTAHGVLPDGEVVDLNNRGEIAGTIRPTFGESVAVVYRPLR